MVASSWVSGLAWLTISSAAPNALSGFVLPNGWAMVASLVSADADEPVPTMSVFWAGSQPFMLTAVGRRPEARTEKSSRSSPSLTVAGVPDEVPAGPTCSVLSSIHHTQLPRLVSASMKARSEPCWARYS